MRQFAALPLLILLAFSMMMFGAMTVPPRALASPLCGVQPALTDATLQTQITQRAASAANKDAAGQKLYDQVVKDFTDLKKNASATPTETLGDAYFFQVCKVILGGEAQASTEQIDKLEIVANALETPPLAKTFLENAKATQQLEITQKRSLNIVPQEDKAKQETSQNETQQNNILGYRGFVTDNVLPQGGGANTNIARQAQNQDCENFGESGDCLNIEQTIKKLKEANLKYNHPDSMYLGRKTLISLIVETTGEDQSKQLEDYDGEIKTGTTKISRFMEATLTGQDFDIEPSGPQRKTLTTLAPVKWTWYVTPKVDGENKNLDLELSAILREGNQALPPVTIKTFSAKINVDVRWWDRVIYKVQAFDPIYQLGAAIGGLASAILLIWRLIVVFRRRFSS